VDALPNRAIRGAVTFLGYQLDPQRRTLTARIELENPGHLLRPGMFAEARLRIPLVSATTRPTTTQAAEPLPPRRETIFGEALRPYSAAYEELVASRNEKVSSLLHEALNKLTPVSADADIKDDYAALTAAVHQTMGQDLAETRETFKNVSIAMVNIGRKIGIPQESPAIVEMHCPMKHGTWLQEVGNVRNPYDPNGMLTCGNAMGNLTKVAAPRPTSRPAMQAGQVLAVPRDAVIDTGLRKVVFVVAKDEQGNEMEGVYDQRVVELGPLAEGFYPVVKGLEPGERVVNRGAFLLDAENRINGQ
jgi:hypothetical protein